MTDLLEREQDEVAEQRSHQPREQQDDAIMSSVRQIPGTQNISNSRLYPVTVGWSANQTRVPPKAANTTRFLQIRQLLP